MRFMRALLWLVARVVPAPFRNRWTEEWRAEIGHAAARGLGARGKLSMAAGAIPDALATRRIARESRTAGPRPSLFHALDQDVRYAMRGLTKSPGFAFGVVLSLAVGIGANATAFSVIDAAMFRTFPGVKDQHELVRISVGPLSPKLF